MRSDRVRVGDTLQAVDGVSCLGLASDKLADMLLGRKGTECVLLLQRSAGPVFEVKLTRQRKGEGASPAKESSSSSSSKGNVHGPGSSAKRSRQPSGSIAHAGFGFTFKRTSGSDASSWRVSRLKPKGFAESSGLIREGDVIVSIGGTSCLRIPAQDLTALIRGVCVCVCIMCVCIMSV
eukprot:Tamp_25613.p2 GENE.Tamp_25613~~Tamp_25613.p2  ORF type:complete len:204 (+),score=19.03 Tamp_25613:77-613(+)